MKIENLEIGQVLKSYKHLCEVLEIPVKTSNSKNAQIKELERYVRYSKDGNKYIIDDIFEKPLDKIDGRIEGNNNSKYNDKIEQLILNLLSEMQEYNGVVFLSKYLLLKQLKMINENYSFCKRRISKLSSFTKISEENIYEFYDSSDSTLVRSLEKTLDNLNDKCLVIWSKEIAVCEATDLNNTIIDNIQYDDYDEEIHNYTKQLSIKHRQATDTESKMLLEMERETIEEMGFNSKRDVAINNMWRMFTNIMTSKVNKIGIAYYYKSYKIIFNEKHINDELIDKYLLNKTEKINVEEELNKDITDKIKENSLNRHLKATDKLNNCDIKDSEVDKYERRSKTEYIQDSYKLTNLLVSGVADIRQIVKTQKTKTKNKK